MEEVRVLTEHHCAKEHNNFQKLDDHHLNTKEILQLLTNYSLFIHLVLQTNRHGNQSEQASTS